jgi:hypothetical protein
MWWTTVTVAQTVSFGVTQEASLPGPGRAWYGTQLAAGDVNGDGHSDLAVPSNEGYEPGRTDVWFGGVGFPSSPSWVSPVGGDALSSWRVAVCDLDGDGFDEVISGSPGSAQVYVDRGSASGPADVSCSTRRTAAG